MATDSNVITPFVTNKIMLWIVSMVSCGKN